VNELSLSVVLDAPATEVWALVGDFGALAEWHPWVPNCSLSDDGLTRTIDLGATAAVEELIPEAIQPLSHSYVVIDSPMPIENYRATWRASPTPGGCRVTWTATFEPLDENAEFMLTAFIKQAFDSLKQRFRQKTDA